MTTMQYHRLPFHWHARSMDRRAGERRRGGAHRGVLAAVVALAFCAWVVVVQHEAPEVDANTARESLAVLDELIAAHGSDQR